MRELKGGMTMLIATHEMGFARVADEVCFLHEGVIAERGTPQAVLPQRPETQRFLRRLLEAEAALTAAGTGAVGRPAPESTSGPLRAPPARRRGGAPESRFRGERGEACGGARRTPPPRTRRRAID